MPLFQYQPPSASSCSATARSGFSRKRSRGGVHPLRARRCAGIDVAVAGLGPGRRDAERQELARPGDRQALFDCPMQRRGLAHQMIRRAHPEHGVRAEALAGVERRERDRSRGIAPARLEQPVGAELRGDLGQLAADQEIVRGPTVMMCSGVAQASTRRTVWRSKLSLPISGRAVSARWHD